MQWVVDSYHGVGGRTGGGYHLIVFFICGFLFCLPCTVSFLSEESMIAVVSFSLFIICFLCLRSLELGVNGAQKLLCL